MRDGSGGSDDAQRLPMQWDSSESAGFTVGRAWRAPQSVDPSDTVAGQRDAPDSLLALHRELIALRREHPALSFGDATCLPLSDGQPLTMIRERGDDRVVLLFNLEDQAVTSPLDPGELDADGFVDLLSGEPLTSPAGIDVPALGFRILQIGPI